MTNILMCSNCGQRNHKDNRFCTRCGSAISESAVIMDEIEYFKRHPRKEDDDVELHEYKSYPTLHLIGEIFKFFGWIVIALGVFLIVIFIMGFFSWSFTSNELNNLPLEIFGSSLSFVTLTFSFGFSLYTILTGLFLIGVGECIHLFIDLQENADRQSILLTLLYMTTKKGRVP